MESLRQILLRRNIYSKEKIERIIETAVLDLPTMKKSLLLINPIKSMILVLLIPILTLLINWILTEHPKLLFVFDNLVAIALMIFSLYFMAIPCIEDILDLEYRQMKKLLKMLDDIVIIDFL